MRLASRSLLLHTAFPAVMPAFLPQVFELFDSKKTNVIDFSEFTLALSVFHPKAPLQEKAACEWEKHLPGSCVAALASSAVHHMLQQAAHHVFQVMSQLRSCHLFVAGLSCAHLMCTWCMQAGS